MTRQDQHQSIPEVDHAIKHRLNSLAENDSEFWSFRGNAKREHVHTYFQYPAMMVPQMQRELICSIAQIAKHTKSLYDPFVGSGTVMTEAMTNGLDFSGRDINPLAVLLCRAKSAPFYEQVFTENANSLMAAINEDGSSQLEVDFPGRDKWFTLEVSKELSRIRRAIQKQECLGTRRLFWVSLAETVRLTSNSRTSTFKLHIRPEQEILDRKNLPIINIFEQILRRNLGNLVAQNKVLQERGYDLAPRI